MLGCPRCGAPETDTGGNCPKCGYSSLGEKTAVPYGPFDPNLTGQWPYTYPPEFIPRPTWPPVAYTGQIEPPVPQGWQCPGCKRYLSPYVNYCRKCAGEEVGSV